MLTQTNKISFFGLGASAIVAHDAQNNFFHFNVHAVYFNDILMQCMSAINSHQGDGTDLHMPVPSRITQLGLIKILATGFILRRGSKFRDNLK